MNSGRGKLQRCLSSIKSARLLFFRSLFLNACPAALFFLLQKCPAGSGVDRDQLVSMFDAEQRDAVTSIHFKDGKLRYLFNYNQRLPFYLLQRALARELGHIVLGHDGSKPEEIRMAEAQCFAHHFLCPRPLIRAIQESGIPFTVEVLGVYDRLL